MDIEQKDSKTLQQQQNFDVHKNSMNKKLPIRLKQVTRKKDNCPLHIKKAFYSNAKIITSKIMANFETQYCMELNSQFILPIQELFTNYREHLCKICWFQLGLTLIAIRFLVMLVLLCLQEFLLVVPLASSCCCHIIVRTPHSFLAQKKTTNNNTQHTQKIQKQQTATVLSLISFYILFRAPVLSSTLFLALTY